VIDFFERDLCKNFLLLKKASLVAFRSLQYKFLQHWSRFALVVSEMTWADPHSSTLSLSTAYNHHHPEILLQLFCYPKQSYCIYCIYVSYLCVNVLQIQFSVHNWTYRYDFKYCKICETCLHVKQNTMSLWHHSQAGTSSLCHFGVS